MMAGAIMPTRIIKKIEHHPEFKDEELYIDYIIYNGKRKIGHAFIIYPDSREIPVHLSSIAIKKESDRGKGYGTILMNAFIKDVDKNDKRAITLGVDAPRRLYDDHYGTNAEIKAYVDRNVKFYTSFGFKIIKKKGGWGGPDMKRPAYSEMKVC